jgi:hypothetical protein
VTLSQSEISRTRSKGSPFVTAFGNLKTNNHPAKKVKMQKVEVIATSHFTDTRIGSVTRKQRLFVPVNVAEDLHSIGMVEYPNNQATATRNPQIGLLADGGGVLPVLLPVAQVLPRKIVIQSVKQDGTLSPPMTVTEEQCSPMSSMPAMSNGGESIKKKRGRPLKVNAGHKITAHP